MKVALPFLVASFLLGSVAAAPQEEEQPSFEGMSLEDLEQEIKKKRDEVDTGAIKAVAEMETREAMETLLRVYDSFASIYMKRELVRELARFDELEDAFQPPLELLMQIAVGENPPELQVAALEELGLCTKNGQTFLALIIDSPADDTIRERAMELHVRLGGPEDAAYYRSLYERKMSDIQKQIKEANDRRKKKKRKKKGEEEEPKVEIVWPTAKIRGGAMAAILESMDDGELVKAFEEDRSMTIKRTALGELARRNHRKAPEFAEAIIGSVNFRGTDRALAAEILLDDQGAEAAPDLIDLALKSNTPEVLRQRIADLLSDMKDEDIDKMTSKLVGKGKAPQKTFAMRATKHLSDEKLAKKVRKSVRDKDEKVAMAAMDAVAARRDREAVDDLEKVLAKTKSDDIRAAALRTLSAIYDGENEWVDRLVEYTTAEDLDMRNAALFEVARLGRRTSAPLFLEALKNENWSTRLIALKALEEQRSREYLAPIVEQMQSETGRLQIEFGEALFRLTGQTFGKRAGTWKRWLEDEGDDVEIISEEEVEQLIAAAEERRLKEISNASFFGIRIESHRVLFILDVSGSMNEPLRAEYIGESGRPRIDYAKDELLKAINALEANALFNIAPFSGGVESWLEDGIASADEMTREDATIYVERLGANGGTNLFGAIEFGFEDPDVDTIFILSDGVPSVGDIIDPQLIRDEIELMNETRNIVINTIAVGGSLQILEWLAEDSGGSYVEVQ
ncbi:MAG: HEAT repeat domain-containing protein [Planctomycetota bacterium]